MNVRNEAAASGVNTCVSTAGSSDTSETLVSTASVDTTASLADRPVSSAVAGIHSPKPSGPKMGAMNRPIAASMLRLPSSTIISRESKLCSTQMMMDAMNMMVNALTRKSLAFSHMWSTTDFAPGMR